MKWLYFILGVVNLLVAGVDILAIALMLHAGQSLPMETSLSLTISLPLGIYLIWPK
jgi:hypothetical protein